MWSTQPKQSDYDTDIKMDQTVTLSDSVSSIKWINMINGYAPPNFATTGWDNTLRIFQITQSQLGPTIIQKAIANLNVAPTNCAWNSDNSIIYVGCIDGKIKAVDTSTMNVADVGQHSAPISSLNYIPEQNVLISTAYENNVNFWQGGPNPVLSVDVQAKVFTSDYNNGTLAGSTANEKIFVIDMATVTSGNKSIMDSVDLGKFSQLQSISLDKKAETIGLATVDGRANISDLKKSAQGYKMIPIITFKSNKQDESGSVVLYPVNSSSFSPAYQNWFMTAGSDGVMSFWDYKARNKIKSFAYGFDPICDAKISPAGNMVAYALGNDWHIGSEGVGKWANKLGVHVITDQEIKFMGVATKR